MNKATGISKPDTETLFEWLRGITGVSMYTGLKDFDRALFHFLNEQLAIDHFAVFTYSPEEGPGHVFTRSIMPEAEAEELARDYVDAYHERDPHFQVAQENTNSQDRPPVHPSFQDEYDPEYRDHFFIQHDLVDKVSVTRKIDGRLVYCNFYRIGDSGQFSDDERASYDNILPLVSNLIATHCCILQLRDLDSENEERSAKSLVHSIISSKQVPFDKLTRRESEVCERILLGFTSLGISLDLNIAESSVNTYRRRAYEKLGIATQNELFTLCISALNKVKK